MDVAHLQARVDGLLQAPDHELGTGLDGLIGRLEGEGLTVADDEQQRAEDLEYLAELEREVNEKAARHIDLEKLEADVRKAGGRPG